MRKGEGGPPGRGSKNHILRNYPTLAVCNLCVQCTKLIEGGGGASEGQKSVSWEI